MWWHQSDLKNCKNHNTLQRLSDPVSHHFNTPASHKPSTAMLCKPNAMPPLNLQPRHPCHSHRPRSTRRWQQSSWRRGFQSSTQYWCWRIRFSDKAANIILHFRTTFFSVNKVLKYNRVHPIISYCNRVHPIISDLRRLISTSSLFDFAYSVRYLSKRKYLGLKTSLDS